MQILYSLSFVWPSGKEWHSTTGDRRSPRWYYSCLLDFVSRHSGSPDVRFVVHMHGMLQSSFPIASMREACRFPSTLEVRYCDAALPAMWPNAQRFEPFLDSVKTEVVIVADIHDVPELQTATIQLHLRGLSLRPVSLSPEEWAITRLLESLNHASDDSDDEDPSSAVAEADRARMILTFWPTADDTYLSDSFHDDRVAPKPALQPTHPRSRLKWVIDGGLALSTAAARTRIRASHHGISFAEHLRECARVYNWDPEEKNGTDEAFLQLYLLSFRALDKRVESVDEEEHMARVVREEAKPFVHNLHRRETTPSLATVHLPIEFVPYYTYKFDPALKNIAYDSEGKYQHRGRPIPLGWAPPRVSGTRSALRRRR